MTEREEPCQHPLEWIQGDGACRRCGKGPVGVISDFRAWRADLRAANEKLKQRNEALETRQHLHDVYADLDETKAKLADAEARAERLKAALEQVVLVGYNFAALAEPGSEETHAE